MTYPTLSAAEFKAQVTSPWAVISIARVNMVDGKDTPMSQKLRQIAAELARILGMQWGRSKRSGAHNDNRSQAKPKLQYNTRNYQNARRSAA
jgi:hypothetical protein